jgi:lysophospholipase L1-like esterase
VTRRFLALGDSYTIGEGVEAGERWPDQLIRGLRDRGMTIDAPHIVAKTGWTTEELASAIERSALRRPFDIVSLLVGVNDQYRGLGVAEYEARFSPLLGRALELAASDPRRLIVVSIPDWGATPFAARDPRGRAAIATEIDRFNVVTRRLAVAAQAAYVDITRISRQAAHDSSLLAADGLHPSAAMYAQWVDLLLPAALAVLDARSP